MAVAFVRDHTGVSNKVSSATNLGVNISTATGVGNLLVLRVIFDNAATASKPTIASAASISKAGGETNNWVFLGAARSTSTTAGLFASGEMWAIRTTVSWPVSSYTITLDTAVVQKASRVTEYSGALAVLRCTSGTAYSTTTTAASAVTTGTTPVIGDVAFSFIFGSNVAASQAGDNDTLGGAWSAVTGVGSTGSTADTNNWGVGQDKILTGANHQTLNNSAAMTAGNGAIVAILQQYVPPAITQAAYQFYADGTETGSTALAAQDTAPAVDVTAGDVNAQLRVRLQSTTSVAVDPWDDFQLQYEKNASGTWANVVGGGVVSSYTAASYITDDWASGVTGISQSFTGDGTMLAGATLRMQKTGAPTGTVTAQLFAHSGTFGSSSVPTGTALATSTNTVNTTSIPTGPATPQFMNWTFDGSFVMSSGTTYCLVFTVAYTFGDSSNFVRSYYDVSAPVHPGNKARLLSGSWTAAATNDLAFTLLGTSRNVTPFNSPSLTDAAATTNRLGAGTGTFVAGKVSEDGLADDVGWAGTNHTELLYAITLKQADLVNGDTLRFRVLRNGATTGFTYTKTPTITVGTPSVRQNSFIGVASGTALTAANSGGTSGDAFDVVNPIGGSLVVDTSADLTTAYDRGLICTLTNAVNVYASWRPVPVADAGYFRFYLRFTAAPTTDVRLLRGVQADDVTSIWGVRLTSAGRLTITDYDGIVCAQSTAALATNTIYRVEAYASLTQLTLRYFAAESTTQEAVTVVVAPTTMMTWNVVRYGAMTTANATWTGEIAAVAWSPTDWIGPAIGGGAPPVLTRNIYLSNAALQRSFAW